MDWGMIGHSWAVNLLAEHVALGRERHAYLFTGPSGVGRRTLALRFSQALSCPNPPAPGQPCRTCPTCRRIEHMQHPDLAVLQAEQEGRTLKIDQVRELQHTLAMAPYEARYRIALVLRFEEAHTSAANAMLKTLEEPPPRVVVILTAKSSESLLPTIVSRCEVLRLRTLSLDETAQGLQTMRAVPQDQAQNLAHISDGRPGYAIRLFEQPGMMEKRQSWLEELVELLGASRRDRFAFAQELAANKEERGDKLQVWLTFWRDVLVSAAGMSTSITNLEYTTHVRHLAQVMGLENARLQVSAVERTMDDIDRNVNARLAIEVLLMDFPRLEIASQH